MIRLPHGFGGLQVSGEAHGPFVMVTWLSYDGRLLETRAGLVAADARRWDEAERQFGIACEFAEQMRNRLELAYLGRLQAGMLLDRMDKATTSALRRRQRACCRDARGRAVGLSNLRDAHLRR